MPPEAVSLYETLRAQSVHGGGQRTGLAALCYHGMLEGLQLLAAEQPTTEALPASRRPPPGADALVRQLANMILHVQSEPMHVY